MTAIERRITALQDICRDVVNDKKFGPETRALFDLIQLGVADKSDIFMRQSLKTIAGHIYRNSNHEMGPENMKILARRMNNFLDEFGIDIQTRFILG